MTTPDSPTVAPPPTPLSDRFAQLRKPGLELVAADFLARHGNDMVQEQDAKAAHAKAASPGAPAPPTPGAAAPPAAPPATPGAPTAGPAVDHAAIYAELVKSNPYLAAQYLVNHPVDVHPALAQPPKVGKR